MRMHILAGFVFIPALVYLLHRMQTRKTHELRDKIAEFAAILSFAYMVMPLVDYLIQGSPVVASWVLKLI